MRFGQSTTIELDYGRVSKAPKLLTNLSGLASVGDLLWTVSDEGRTLECLQLRGDRYELSASLAIDDFDGLNIPRLDQRGEPYELDLEAASFAGSHLWIAGSHCRVRETVPKHDEFVLPTTIARLSRNVLMRLKVEDGAIKRARILPLHGAGSLRSALANDPFLKDFLDLPSKENGLDVEGLCALDKNHVLLGLRGPVLDGRAVVVSLTLADDLTILSYELHFLKLGGLGIRDLTRWADGFLVLAGPVTDAHTPFRLFRWALQAPTRPARAEEAECVLEFAPTGEKPEGMCQLARPDGSIGLLVVYDHPDETERLVGSTYRADWFPLLPDGA